MFRAELRLAQQVLNATHSRIYQSLCDASLGDSRCGVALATPALQGFANVTALDDLFRVVVTGLKAFAEGWFAFGVAHWSDGQRLGLFDVVVSHAWHGSADVLGFAARISD